MVRRDRDEVRERPTHASVSGGRYRGDLGPASRAQTVVPRGGLRRAGGRADPAARARARGAGRAGGEVRRRRERLHGSVRAETEATAGGGDARRRRRRRRRGRRRRDGRRGRAETTRMPRVLAERRRRRGPL